jgi:hypothetical protein
MDTLIPHSSELGLVPDALKVSETMVTEPDSASFLEAIQVRASILTPVIEEILDSRPSSHWGINE